MPERFFTHFLRWTGVITALAGLQFFAPRQVLALQGIAVGDPAGLFFAQHWAMLVLCFGALLVLAASQPALRAPIVVAAVVEKAAFVALVLLNWNEPLLAGLKPALLLDAPCVLVYGAWLLMRGRAAE